VTQTDPVSYTQVINLAHTPMLPLVFLLSLNFRRRRR